MTLAVPPLFPIGIYLYQHSHLDALIPHAAAQLEALLKRALGHFQLALVKRGHLRDGEQGWQAKMGTNRPLKVSQMRQKRQQRQTKKFRSCNLSCPCSLFSYYLPYQLELTGIAPSRVGDQPSSCSASPYIIRMVERSVVAFRLSLPYLIRVLDAFERM